MNMDNLLDLKACQLLKTYLSDLFKSLKLLKTYSSIYDNSAVIARYVGILSFTRKRHYSCKVFFLQTDKVIR